MDPLTHTVSGLALANLMTGDEHRLAFSLTLAFAANLPDVDFITKPMKTLGSPKHYHNVTHSLLGAVALSLVSAWVLHAVYPFASYVTLCALMLAGCALHIFLDTVMTSCYVRLFWPFRLRQSSLELLVGLNPVTASKRCGQMPYLVCPVCQLRGALFNPFPICLTGGLLAAWAFPVHRQWIALVSLAVPLAYLAVQFGSKQRAKQAIRARVTGIDPSALHIYPSHMIPFRWLAILEEPDRYRRFRVQGLPAKVEAAPPVPRPESLTDPALVKSRESDLYQNVSTRFAHPYARVEERGGETLVSWTDLRFDIDPRVVLYTLKCRFSNRNEPISEEFRERWHP